MSALVVMPTYTIRPWAGVEVDTKMMDQTNCFLLVDLLA